MRWGRSARAGVRADLSLQAGRARLRQQFSIGPARAGPTRESALAIAGASAPPPAISESTCVHSIATKDGSCMHAYTLVNVRIALLNSALNQLAPRRSIQGSSNNEGNIFKINFILYTHARRLRPAPRTHISSVQFSSVQFSYLLKSPKVAYILPKMALRSFQKRQFWRRDRRGRSIPCDTLDTLWNPVRHPESSTNEASERP